MRHQLAAPNASFRHSPPGVSSSWRQWAEQTILGKINHTLTTDYPLETCKGGLTFNTAMPFCLLVLRMHAYATTVALVRAGSYGVHWVAQMTHTWSHLLLWMSIPAFFPSCVGKQIIKVGSGQNLGFHGCKERKYIIEYAYEVRLATENDDYSYRHNIYILYTAYPVHRNATFVPKHPTN